MSGLIARKKRENVRVTIAVATIGIRGTHFEGEVTERQEKGGKTVDASAKVALLEPEGSDAGNAVVVENKFGSVVIDKPGYGTEIPDEKSPTFAGEENTAAHHRQPAARCVRLREWAARPGGLSYDFLDAGSFFKNPVRKTDRSRMNIPFTLAAPKLDGEFLKDAEARGMMREFEAKRG